uniref:malectin domain-containing carbohydrate-binding protein n=1 Tax=Pedobacter sp. TaxID=1411316 RepID=UPI003D7F4336
GEGLRELDRVGPVNYKGLFTPWEEPADVFYMFRANYAPKETEPMVYLVSHTWANRWLAPSLKDSITVYSNCDEVELFNDVNKSSLGKRTRNGIGTHFQWDGVEIKYNILYAVGYVNGKAVAKDYIVLNNLPQSPNFNGFHADATNLTAAAKNYHYVYRLNCGGPDYVDENGALWSADRQLSSPQHFGSTSWTAAFPGVPSFFASQRRTSDPIKGTRDWKLFQTFRYGRDQLAFHFPVPDGDYQVELYFNEPWLATGGGMDATGMRLFDVAINGETLIKDLDIWKEAGHDGALKKSIKAQVKGGQLVISFPQVKSGQALISAIAIASLKQHIKPAPASKGIASTAGKTNLAWKDWMDIGDKQYLDEETQLSSLPSNLYGAQWLSGKSTAQRVKQVFEVNTAAEVYVATLQSKQAKLAWLETYEDTKTVIENNKGQLFHVYRKRFEKGATVTLGESATPYLVAVLPASNLEPAYDLKAITNYKAIDARLAGKTIAKAELMGKERVSFNAASGDFLEWIIKVGVADTYSLAVKYHNPLERTLKGRMEFLSLDGTLMKTEPIEFKYTKPGKWNYFNTSTGSMINAGTYLLRVIAEDAKGLSLDALAVQ